MFAAAAAVQTVIIKSRDCFESSDRSPLAQKTESQSLLISFPNSFKSLLPLQQRIKDVEASLKAPSDGRMQTVD